MPPFTFLFDIKVTWADKNKREVDVMPELAWQIKRGKLIKKFKTEANRVTKCVLGFFE